MKAILSRRRSWSYHFPARGDCNIICKNTKSIVINPSKPYFALFECITQLDLAVSTRPFFSAGTHCSIILSNEAGAPVLAWIHLTYPRGDTGRANNKEGVRAVRGMYINAQGMFKMIVELTRLIHGKLHPHSK